MASLRQLPDGKYRVYWREQGKQRSLIVKTKRKADLELKRIAGHEAAARPARSGAILPLSEVVTRWCKAKKAEGKDPLHMDKAASRLKSAIQKAGWTRTDAVTPLAVQDWRATGCARTASVLRGMLQWSFVVLDQPVHERALALLSGQGSTVKPKRELLTDKHVELLLASAAKFSASGHAVVHCLSTYGWRPITAARMTVGDVDLVAGKVTTRVKGGHVVQHPILPATLELLRPLAAFRKPSLPLFLDPRSGRGWDLSDGLSEWFRSVSRVLLPSKVGIYDLKRYAITRMLKHMRREQAVVFTGHLVLAQLDTYVVQNEETKQLALTALTETVQQNATGSRLLPPLGQSSTTENTVKTL